MIEAAYNVAPYIDAFFESILAQTGGLDVLEVVVVDDGSTDATGEIVRRWARRHPRLIRHFRQENGGVAAARRSRNRGRSCRCTLSTPEDSAAVWPPPCRIVRDPREKPMDKWKIMTNSKVVRATAGASTLVATAVVVGAGWKWG